MANVRCKEKAVSTKDRKIPIIILKSKTQKELEKVLSE